MRFLIFLTMTLFSALFLTCMTLGYAGLILDWWNGQSDLVGMMPVLIILQVFWGMVHGPLMAEAGWTVFGGDKIKGHYLNMLLLVCFDVMFAPITIVHAWYSKVKEGAFVPAPANFG